MFRGRPGTPKEGPISFHAAWLPVGRAKPGKEQLLLKHTKRTYPRIALTSLGGLWFTYMSY